jgi:hypothetical protein
MPSLTEHWAVSCWWEVYHWKNELSLQAGRAIEAFSELQNDDFDGDWSPMDMLERALILSAFSMRRTVEKKLITDRLAAMQLKIDAFPASDSYRTPYHGSSGGSVFKNYDFSKAELINMTLGQLANEIIHSSQLLVLGAPTNHLDRQF